jgi:hypothetical protein
MLQRYWLGAVLTLGVLSVPAHGQATLEWKFKPGETFFLETVSTFKQTMQTPGKTFKQELEQTTVFEINVKDVNPDKSVVLEEKVAGIQFKNAAGGAGGPEEKFGQQLEGATFKLTLGPDGKPTALEGYADVVKKIAGADEQARKAVEAILTEDSLKRTAAEAFSFLPGKAVAANDTWEQEFTTSLGPLGGFKTKRKYKYDGKETVEGKEYDKVTFTAATEYTPPKAGEASAFLFQVTKADLKVTDVSGYYHFAAGDGRLVRGEQKMKLNGTVTLTISNQPVETGVEQEQTVRLRVLDKNPLAK